MRKPPHSSLYMSDVDLVATVPGYDAMRKCLYALQLAHTDQAPGSGAHALVLAGCYLLREVISAMPDQVIQAWAENDRETYGDLLRRERDG